MELFFRDRKIRKKCNSFQELVENYGPHAAKRIRQRLDELQATNDLAEFLLLPSILHNETYNDDKIYLSVVVTPPLNLIIMPIGHKSITQDINAPKWKHIISVLIVNIDENG